MPDLARIDEVCDAVVARIEALWAPTPPESVRAEDVPDFNTDPDDGPVMTGRQVVVLPDSYDSPEVASRTEDVDDYSVVVLIAHRFPEQGPPPASWVRAERLWVQDVIYRPLTNPRAAFLLAVDGEPGSGLWPVQPSGVATAYDADELRDAPHVFFSVVRLKYREHRDAES